jgi:hypothetical protein
MWNSLSDAVHKKFSVFVAVNEKGQAGEALRVAHDRQLYREFLTRLPAHSAIAVGGSSNYSWLVDGMERAGHCVNRSIERLQPASLWQARPRLRREAAVRQLDT